MSLLEKCSKQFANGTVYLLHTEDGYPIETTDTFLPFYTKDAIGSKQNTLQDYNLGSRYERWMIGVSTMSGCPVRCKFCATGKLRRTKLLSATEIIQQVEFVLSKHNILPNECQEFKINYTRMGEPFLNIDSVKEAIRQLDAKYNNIHHFVSTIGIEGADYSWVTPNVTIQFSIHSFDEEYRNWLIPYKKKVRISDMGRLRTNSTQKTTLNLTMVRPNDFDIDELKRIFDREHFFIKISPVNQNDIASNNGIGQGIITQTNLI